MKASIFHPPQYVDVQVRPDIFKNNVNAEIVWTYLVAKKYLNDPYALVEKLCGRQEKLPKNTKIWLETFLYPTRIRKMEQAFWKVRADLALGHLELARNRNSQVRSNGDWVCIAESKWFADIHPNKKFPEIYQLSQIIEHALLLHSTNGKSLDKIYFTLVTPRYFKDRQGRFSNRLYHQKFFDYKNNPEILIEDLRLCPLQFLKKDHNVEAMVDRIGRLVMRWVTFEDLLGLPNLVEDHVPGKYRCTFSDWKAVFENIGLGPFYYELVAGA
jgi:hypothetical protein